MADFDVIFVVGPQGSGKGTQGKKLADKLGFLFWGMGGMLRGIQASDVQFAAKIALANRGTLLPDEVIIEILKDRLPQIPPGRGIVFDGVPRRLTQAEFLVPYLRGRGYGKFATVFLDLPRGESVKRLLLRARHEERIDDTPEGIETRFRYYDETMPTLLEYLRRETAFFDIDGNPGVEEVEREINAALRLA